MTARSLSDYIITSKDGEWGQAQPFEGGVQMLVIRGTDFDAVRLGDWSSVPIRYVVKRHADAKRLQDRDIIIETAGGSRDRPTGRTLLVKNEMLAQVDCLVTCASFARFIRLDQSLVEPTYVFWWLQYLYATRQLLAFHTQHTGVARFQWTTCSRTITIPQVDRKTQLKIASILSAYDDFIENGHRRIRILEEMARRVYREWFVEFRYSGHREASWVPSVEGAMPEGWSMSPLSALAGITMGQSPPSSAYNTDGFGLAFHQGVGSYGAIFPIHQMYSSAGTRIAEAGDILMSVRAPVGRINLADRRLILGRGLCAIRAGEAQREFLWQALKHFFQEEDIIGGGSIFQSVTKNDVERLPLLWPGRTLAGKFADIAEPIWHQLYLLTMQMSNLRSTRDLLLPRLITGRVDISDLDIAVPMTAA